MARHILEKYDRIIFYTLKLPLIYITIPLGFIFEYLITFPYIVLTTIDGLLNKKQINRTPGQTD